MSIVEPHDRRVTTTPNATMTTLASPTLGDSRLSLWQVEMNPGVTGPLHAFAEQVTWAITHGTGTLTTDDGAAPVPLQPGTTLVLDGGRMRRFTAGPAGFTAVVAAVPSEVTAAHDVATSTPPWVA